MRQRPGGLRTSPVGHQPAGHRDGHRHQGQKGSDDERDDEADLGDANILVSSPASLGVNQGVCPSLNGKNGVGVDGDLLSQLSGVDLRFRLGLSLLPPVGVVPGTVLGLTLAEADSDVAVELDVVAAGELEGVEDGGENSLLSLVLPLSEDGRIRSTAVLVRHQILVVSVIIHGLGHTAPGVTSVDGIRLHIHLEHETITDLSSVYILSIGITNSHGAGGRGASVGNGPGCGQHGHIEAHVNLLYSSVVYTAYSVGLGLESHQLGMFLDDENKVGFSLKY